MCYEVRFESRKCAKMRLRPGLRPDPAGGAHSAPPDPLAGFGERVGNGGMKRAREGK